MIEDNNVEIDAIIEDDSVNLETDLDYRGERGPVGETPDITIGKVDTLSPEDNAYVEKEGTKENITLNFGIPKGETGDIGPVGPTGPSGIYIGSDEPQDPEVDVWIDPTVTPENYVKEKELDDKLNSMIESGELIGPQGPQGIPGKDGIDGINGQDGVGITTITSGQSSVEEDKTITPVTVQKTDGSSESFNVEAKNGIDGQDGVNGQDGLTPTIGENGNWFLGDTDTGKPSRGEIGPTPDLSDYVKNMDYATGEKGGVVKVNSNSATVNENGYLEAQTITQDQYDKAYDSEFISKGTLENIKNDYVGSSTPVQDLTATVTNIQEEQDENKPKNTASGEIVSVDDAIAYKTFEVKIDGSSEQAATKGTQLFNANAIVDSGIVVSDNGKTITMPVVSEGNGGINTTVTLQELCPTLQAGDIVYLNFERNLGLEYNNYIYLSGTDTVWYVNTSHEITQSELEGTVYLYGNRFIDGETEQCILTNFRITKNQSDDFEYYTGGQPSPSPDYPQEIKILTFDKITRCGKNLFDYNDVNAVADEIEVGDNGWITAKFDNTEGSTIKFVNYFTNKINLKPNHKYNVFLEVKAVEGEASIVPVSYYRPLNIDEYNKNEGQFITGFTLNFKDIKNGNIYNKVCVTDNTFKDLKISLRTFIQYNPGTKGAITFRLSLLEDTSVTSQTFVYEPYQSAEYAIDLQGNEMVEITNGVKDKLVINKYGNVSLIKNVGKKILNGSEDWMLNTNYTTSTMLAVQYLENGMLSNSRIKSDNFTYNKISEINTIRAAAQFVLISLDIKKFATVDDFKTWLSTHNTIAYYELTEPQTIPLGKLTDIITTLNGTNNISINGNIPTTISTTYALDIKKYIDKKLAEISTQMIEEG